METVKKRYMVEAVKKRLLMKAMKKRLLMKAVKNQKWKVKVYKLISVYYTLLL